MEKLVKIIVYIPESYGNLMREKLGEAGAGRIGNYSHCTFTTKGISRFKADTGAKPATGKKNGMQEVVEEKIEVSCQKSEIKKS